jgi:outer membrane scaffolding protein for murein synthesis (MipA/OmpV family)
LQIDAGDTIFSKLKYGNNWLWHQAFISAKHANNESRQTLYDVTVQFNGNLSMGLKCRVLFPINDEKYWKSYFGITRQSGIVANFHRVGHQVFSGLAAAKVGVCDRVAITTFAQLFFKKLWDTRYVSNPYQIALE